MTREILIDKPITNMDDDSFELKTYVAAFKEIIVSCKTPMTISIQGDWGSGKTSFVELVFSQLEHSILPIRFNTWKYSQFSMENDISIMFLKEFVNSVVVNSDSKHEALGIIDALCKHAGILGFPMTKLVQHFTGKEINFKNIIEKIVEELSGSSQEANNVVEQISELQKILLENIKKQGKRVVIFVDDLDRLAPSKVIELLEVLQTFLTFENCVFIVAVDYQVVTQGFKEKMGESYTLLKSKNFFDKIIQLPFTLPEASLAKSGNYLEKLMLAVNMSRDEVNALKDKFSEILNSSVQFNPRQLKRIMNSYWLLRLVSGSEYTKTDSDSQEKINNFSVALFYMLCMQTEYEYLYKYFQRNYAKSSEIESFLSDILNKELDEFEKQSDIKKIVKSMKEETNSDETYVLQSLKLFLESFNEYFGTEYFVNEKSESKIDSELLVKVMDLTRSTGSEKDKAESKMKIGEWVRNTISEVSLSAEEIEALTKEELCKTYFGASMPIFRDVTGKTAKEIDDQRYYILNNRGNQARYYKDPIKLTIKGTKEDKKLLLSSQWKYHQEEKYNKWLSEKKLKNDCL